MSKKIDTLETSFLCKIDQSFAFPEQYNAIPRLPRPGPPAVQTHSVNLNCVSFG